MKPRDVYAPLAWPALLALAAVIVLSTGIMLYDISRDVVAQARIEELVDQALGSVSRVDDLRRDLNRLVADPDDRVLAHLALDATAYDALATYAGERAEWTRTQVLLERLQQLGVMRARLDLPLIRDIEASLDRIVAINRAEAARTVIAIRGSFRQDFGIDAIGGTISLLLALAVGAAVLRSVRHQRALLAAELARKVERQRELEAFAGRVAHDLRGPLTPLRTFAELLETGGSPVEMGQRIQRAVDRMTAIIEELLALSLSGQPGEGDAEVAPVVEQVLDDNRTLLAGAKVDVAITADKVHSPPSTLCRIVQNLVSNAIKYRNPDRPLELGITASRQADEVELVVSDNGIGMDEGTAAHAFDPLFRGDDTRKIPGHGLGLAIVKRTVEALGGTCRIISRLGEGTQFVLRLPAH